MKHIKTIYEKEIFPEKEEVEIEYRERLTAKAIIFNSDGLIAMVGSKSHPYSLLPGGGVDDGEDYEAGIIRELKEEIGCDIEISECVGEIDDYRSLSEKHYITRCFYGKIRGEIGELILVPEEIENGFFVKWVGVESALNLLNQAYSELQQGKVEAYNIAFNILRDKLFLEEFTKTRNDE